MKAAHSTFLPVSALVFNALVWGVSWWPFRQLEGHGLHPLWSTTLIYLMATVAVLVWRPAAWRGFAKAPALWWLFVAAGLTNVGFNWAVTVGDVVRVVLLFYLMPAWSVLIAWLVLKDRPTRGSLLRLVLALAGVVIVLKVPGSPWPIPNSAADWLALAGGLSFAVTNVMLRKLGDTPSEWRMVAMFVGGAVLASLAAGAGMLAGIVSAPALDTQALPIALVLCTAFLISNLALQYGAARLAASTTAIVMLSELLFASVSSAWLGAADINMRTLVGGSFIVLAALLAARAPAPTPTPSGSARDGDQTASGIQT
ncbi:MAG: DMT family transporter [Pseudomonadota bacterium]